MKRFVALALGAALTGSALPVIVGGVGSPAEASPGQGIGWQYSESANGYYRPPQDDSGGGGGGGGGGIPLVFTDYGTPGEWLECPSDDETFACENDPGAEITGILCGGDGVGPRGLPEYPWIRYERTLENGEPTRWVGKEADCSEPGEDDFVPMEEISYTVDYEVFQPLGDPQIRMHPQNGKTLVGLPTVVSTDHPAGLEPPAELLSMDADSASVRIPIHIDRPGGGLDGEILADASFAWEFRNENGSVEGTAAGRGQPYDESVNPIDNPGYYTAGEFDTAGEKTIAVTATWAGTVTVESLAPEEIVPIDIPASRTVEVVDSQSVLTK